MMRTFSFKRSNVFAPVVVSLMMLCISVIPALSRADDLVKPSLKQGYYFALIPVGELVFVDSKENFGPWGSFGGQLRMGEALNHWIDLGISGGASYARGDSLQLVHGHFAMDATFKPTRFLALGFQAGMGFADFTRLQKGMDEVIGRFGATYGFTVAYDFFPGGKRDPYKSGGLAITPVAGVHLGPGEVTSVYSVFAGLSVAWWTGLPKSQLDLPVDQAF
ncbi:MAG: hypothetical protein JXX14_08435 [Deltaproteobacteria bacterium]|nr:hypothetical protein [Deltaproteobacteria bacterium]